MQSGLQLGCAALTSATAPLPAVLSVSLAATAPLEGPAAAVAPASGDLAALNSALAVLDHAWRHVHLQHAVLAGALTMERNFIDALRSCRHRCPVERETSPHVQAELLSALGDAIRAMHRQEHQYRELRARLLAAGELDAARWSRLG